MRFSRTQARKPLPKARPQGIWLWFQAIARVRQVSIVAGNSITNLRQAIYEVLKSRGQCCRCIRCREVRDWPETAEGLRLKVRDYRSSGALGAW